MSKAGKSAAGNDAKAGKLLPGSPKTPSASGGHPPKHTSGMIKDAKSGTRAK